jgi:hypothetical protein
MTAPVPPCPFCGAPNGTPHRPRCFNEGVYRWLPRPG